MISFKSLLKARPAWKRLLRILLGQVWKFLWMEIPQNLFELKFALLQFVSTAFHTSLWEVSGSTFSIGSRWKRRTVITSSPWPLNWTSWTVNPQWVLLASPCAYVVVFVSQKSWRRNRRSIRAFRILPIQLIVSLAFLSPCKKLFKEKKLETYISWWAVHLRKRVETF